MASACSRSSGSVFFFSSRRRHTRYWRDWSSDVCSSDLTAVGLQIKPEVDRFEHEWLTPRLHWKKVGRRFMYQQTDRGHQRFRVIEVDSQTGAIRNIIDEIGRASCRERV